MSVKFVVGSKFWNPEVNDVYTSIDTFRTIIENHPYAVDNIYVPGQGLSESERQDVIDTVRVPAIKKYFLNNGKLLNSDKTHKCNDYNILISELSTITHGKYRSCLYLHQDNELLLDHFDGSHIPGMVLLEATRQLAIATWSQFEQRDTSGMAMVINDIHCHFHDFAFPFCINIDISIDRVEKDNNYRLNVEFIQNGNMFSNSYGTFRVIENKKLRKLERIYSKKILNNHKRYLEQDLEETVA
ncbi:AfsA-related hotdog domain-containing protein [Vreelandella nigrificans]|uniref:AfsA-related hotdog domain-containing protein n=1 Tax=Vreelandella nigrificans TaxID=2042704 RepID=UPI0013FE365B|nr:AfsA-related hotdog domain-containing protein [Halomonas nigrificans]